MSKYVYVCNLNILCSALKNRMPKKFTIANIGHQVSKSWLGPWHDCVLSVCFVIFAAGTRTLRAVLRRTPAMGCRRRRATCGAGSLAGGPRTDTAAAGDGAGSEGAWKILVRIDSEIH